MNQWLRGLIGLALLGWPLVSAQAAPPAHPQVIRRIFFTIDRAEIRPDARPVLREVANLLRADPGLKLRLVGHTCDLESNAYNLDLSRRRADQTLAYLANVEGIARARIIHAYAGEEDPLVPNRDEAHRAMNRRVELTLASSFPGANLRSVTVTVVDSGGSFVPELTAAQFTVREAGISREIVRVTPALAPTTLTGLVFLDFNRTVNPADLREAAGQYLGINPSATHRHRALARDSGLRLYDAIARISAGNLASHPQPRRLVIFSDGIAEPPRGSGPDASTKTLEQAVAAAIAGGVTLITVEIGPTSAEGRRTLRELADRTGGQALVWDRERGAAQFGTLARLPGNDPLKGTYTLEYRSAGNVPAEPVVESSAGQVRPPR